MSTQVLIQSISEISLPRINLRKVFILGFILITVLVAFYIFQISEITKSTFSISKYEKEITVFSQQNKDLETNLFDGNSLTNLETAINNFNYEKINKVHYIQIMDNEMAVRR